MWGWRWLMGLKANHVKLGLSSIFFYKKFPTPKYSSDFVCGMVSSLVGWVPQVPRQHSTIDHTINLTDWWNWMMLKMLWCKLIKLIPRGPYWEPPQTCRVSFVISLITNKISIKTFNGNMIICCFNKIHLGLLSKKHFCL